jgi:hypothetical protein
MKERGQIKKKSQFEMLICKDYPKLFLEPVNSI